MDRQNGSGGGGQEGLREGSHRTVSDSLVFTAICEQFTLPMTPSVGFLQLIRTLLGGLGLGNRGNSVKNSDH